MLSNIVGTLLAFVTIMLMLSLIVTSLVQFTQATLRLRARNLLVGVAALIQKHAPHENVSGIARSPLRWNAHAAVAAHVLNEADASVKYLTAPNATGRVLMGPPVSWVNSDDLARALVKTEARHAATNSGAVPEAAKAVTKSMTNATADALAVVPTGVPAAAGNQPQAPAAVGASSSAEAIKQSFENMEPGISKRFQFIMRIWTVAWSFLIALTFQLSTPDLLKQLPSTDAKRQAIIAAIPSLTAETTRKLAFSTDDILEESLKRLGDKFPAYREVFAEVAGDEDPRQDKKDMLAEMKNVLGKRADRDAVLSEYSSIIDSLSQSTASAALTNSSNLIGQLDTFGIAPKLDNFEFYSSHVSDPVGPNKTKTYSWVIHWSNLFGVLVTGILLSLGAPFWFEQLKNLSSLRDAMAPTSPAKTS